MSRLNAFDTCSVFACKAHKSDLHFFFLLRSCGLIYFKSRRRGWKPLERGSKQKEGALQPQLAGHITSSCWSKSTQNRSPWLNILARETWHSSPFSFTPLCSVARCFWYARLILKRLKPLPVVWSWRKNHSALQLWQLGGFFTWIRQNLL